MLRLVTNDDQPPAETTTQPQTVVKTKENEPSDLERSMQDAYLKKKQLLADMRVASNKSVTRQYRLKK